MGPDTFASGSTFVSAFQVGRFFGGGASDIGFATSTNGGTSFSSGFLPGTTAFSTPSGIYGRSSLQCMPCDTGLLLNVVATLGGGTTLLSGQLPSVTTRLRWSCTTPEPCR